MAGRSFYVCAIALNQSFAPLPIHTSAAQVFLRLLEHHMAKLLTQR